MYEEELEEVVDGSEEVTEEQPTQEQEEQVQTEPQEEQKFTQADVDRMVNDKLNEILPGKINRREAKIRRENDRQYGELMGLLRAGTGKESVEDITGALKGYFGQRGVQAPAQPQYSERETQILAQAEAEDIIRGGYEEVKEEVDRLARIGAQNMRPHEKALFVALGEKRKQMERGSELEKLGVQRDVYESKEFQDFSKMFDEKTPMQSVLELWQKTRPQKETYKTMGSMKQAPAKGPKDYYSPEEIARLDDELDDDQVWEAVRRSMTGK
jgi:hypothetical protein